MLFMSSRLYLDSTSIDLNDCQSFETLSNEKRKQARVYLTPSNLLRGPLNTAGMLANVVL